MIRMTIITLLLLLQACTFNSSVEVEKVTLPPAATQYLQRVCEANGFETYEVYFTKSAKRPMTFIIELITMNKLAAHLDRNFKLRREIAEKVFEQLDWEKQLETHTIDVIFTEDDGRFFFNHGHSIINQFNVHEGSIMDGF